MERNVPRGNADTRVAVGVVADAMARVLERMRRLPYGTSVEAAFIQVIHELEAEAANLDPMPVVFKREAAGRQAGERAEYGLKQYLAPEEAVFAPRDGFNRDETRYVDWVNNVENER